MVPGPGPPAPSPEGPKLLVRLVPSSVGLTISKECLWGEAGDRGGLGLWVCTAVKLCLFSRWCRVLGPRRRGATAVGGACEGDGERPMLGEDAWLEVGEGKDGSGLVTAEEDEEDVDSV